MEIAKEQPVETKDEPKKESREQRRLREGINEDANKTFVALAEKFRIFFMDNDPDGEEVKTKAKEVDAKWRVYCKNRGLIPEAYPQVSDFCKELIQEYKNEYDNAPSGPAQDN